MATRHVRPPPGLPSPSRRRPPRACAVLAADDDPVSRQVLEAGAEEVGLPRRCSARTARPPSRRCCSRDGPRVAILDWEMPGLDGIDVIREARARTPAASLYLLLLTGRTDTADIVRGLDAGADDYLTKPFDLDVLRARVSVGTRMMSLQRSLAQRIEDLALAEARYRELVEGVGVAVWQADARDVAAVVPEPPRRAGARSPARPVPGDRRPVEPAHACPTTGRGSRSSGPSLLAEGEAARHSSTA